MEGNTLRQLIVGSGVGACHTPKPRMAETSGGGGLHVEYHNMSIIVLKVNTTNHKYNQERITWFQVLHISMIDHDMSFLFKEFGNRSL